MHVSTFDKMELNLAFVVIYLKPCMERFTKTSRVYQREIGAFILESVDLFFLLACHGALAGTAREQEQLERSFPNPFPVETGSEQPPNVQLLDEFLTSWRRKTKSNQILKFFPKVPSTAKVFEEN
ncbi:hypothetical protein VNO77_20071 [Canavalia gladiata]|uniref:Uncharacterized protein n=1 Tax=Canavalia gladiata TaxID=3824 RepID=A0AAN9QL36_CANGL